MTRWLICLSVLGLSCAMAPRGARGQLVLPGAAPLDWQEDDQQIASRLVESVDRFLLRKLEESIGRRAGHWRRDLSSSEKYVESLSGNRQRLAHILGVRDPRVPLDALELVGDTSQGALVGRGAGYEILAVRWPVVGDMTGEGLLLEPVGGTPPATFIVLPDADQTPEAAVGLTETEPPAEAYARRLAESGCRVIVPVLISRERQPRNQRAVLTHREYIYRSAYVLGRHVIGYEVQKVLALVDWLAGKSGGDQAKIGVMGWGEGGLLALYAAALDVRLDAACVSGYFDSRQQVWREPIDRNVFGLLEQFGDAELAAMIAPRPLIIEACQGPDRELPTEGGAPGRLTSPPRERVAGELARARQLLAGAAFDWPVQLVLSQGGQGAPGSPETLSQMLQALGLSGELAAAGPPPERLCKQYDPTARQQRQVYQMDRHNQWLLRESPYVRQTFWEELDLIAARRPGAFTAEQYASYIETYRDYFRQEIIGQFDDPLMEPNPRVRQTYEGPSWRGFEVVLDVFPGVFAYGVLLAPKDIRPGERRPVVVCQHGLEGQPRQLIEGDHRAYHDFAAKLAEQGFVTFAPQNVYVLGDRFRTLQRKANPLKKTLFSIMVPQHEQIVRWLGSLPFVDARRIAFYGLSYGGKSAMRIPALVDGYCLSICSGDFNDWVWKNASTRCRYSYVWTGEYEIFEYDLGSTFNYAEMAALIAPRPFMVERGHFDGVAPDEAVAYEFAKVRLLYEARLALPESCLIEWFVGPHTINGQGTFQFLRRRLQWPGE